MAPHKRTDPGKLARDREAIRKSQEAMAKPKTDFFGTLKNIDKGIKQYFGRKFQENKEKAEGYGPNPRMEGAGVIDRPSPGQVRGGMVTGLK